MTTFARFAGLHTTHNYVGSTPPGAMATADNCVISAQDTVEPRRGQYSLPYTFGTSTDRANALWSYANSLLVQYGTSIARDTGSAFSAYSGTFTPVDDTTCRMRGVEAEQNLYVNTSTGVKVLDAPTNAFSDAGVPQCLDVSEVGATVEASGFLANNYAAAYRAIAGQKDANGQWHYGPPSQRTVVANRNLSAGAGTVVRASNVVTVTVPAGNDWPKYLAVGATITASSTDTGFSGTVTHVISAVNTAANTFTYPESNVDATNTQVVTFSIANRSTRVAVGIPPGLTTSDVIQVFRTDTVTDSAIDPGDETYQVDEVNPPASVSVAAGGVVATGTTVVVTSNGHPYVIGQSVECSGQTNIPSGVNLITAVTTNTFTYVDPTASTQTSTQTLTYTPRTVVIEDNTPNGLLGDPLYTNPNTGDGLAASRYPPPRSLDMAWFNSRMWFMNTTDKHRFSLQVIGVGAPGGVQAGDWIEFTVSGTTYRYTAGTSTIPTSRQFLVWTSDTAALNIERTALELIRCINQDESTCPFYAVYNSAENDVPGKVLIVEKSVGGSTIYAQASRAASWNPILPGDGTLTVGSDNSADPAGLTWSDSDQPESVPLGNSIRVGAKGDPTLRGVGLRDALFVFKQKGGVWVIPVFGVSAFVPRVLDPTCQLLAPDTVVALNNQIYALTKQGLCAVNEGGVDIIGWPIDYDVRALLNQAQSKITRIPFAVAYESERTLQLWLPADGTSTHAYQSYWYNYATKAFTRVPLERTCGLVTQGTDLLYMGSGISNTLVRERKSFDETDYADEALSVTLSAMSGTTLTLSSTVGISVGDLITDGVYNDALITAISGNTVTVSEAASWTVPSTLTVYQGFDVNAVTVPLTLGDPGLSKQLGRVVLSFRSVRFQTGAVTVATDDAPATQEYAFEDTAAYGQGGYGQGGYGDPSVPINRYATLGTTGSFVQLGLHIREARAAWKLLAFTPQIAGQTERGR